jgi:hypothetical protein
VHERTELRVPPWVCQNVEQLLTDVGEDLPGPLPLCPVLLVARAFVVVMRLIASAFRLGPLLFFKAVEARAKGTLLHRLSPDRMNASTRRASRKRSNATTKHKSARRSSPGL